MRDDYLKQEIVAAAIARHNAQFDLERAAGSKEVIGTWGMRELQAKVNTADKRIRDAVKELVTIP